MAKVGFIGIGLMGLPMCRRLLANKVELWVYNRNSLKCDPLVQEGAQLAHSISQLSQEVDVIMLCISNTDAVLEVSNQLLCCVREGQIILDFSSIDPATTREIAQSFADKQVSWLDTPVSGGVAGAQAGSLAIMAGGDEQTVHHVQPLLDMLGQRTTYMGPSGAGQTTKICNQMLVSCNVLVMAEVMGLAKRAGVDAAQIPEALKGGFADSIPLQLTGPRMATNDFAEIKWHVKTLLKDLAMAEQLASVLGSDTPMAKLGKEIMQAHAEIGFAEQDPATLVSRYTDTSK